MEGDASLQDVLSFIATGLQNAMNCDSQLLLLLVMLEEIYEAGDSIPLLTDRKESVERLIRFLTFYFFDLLHSESVSGIIKSVSLVLESNSVHHYRYFTSFHIECEHNRAVVADHLVADPAQQSIASIGSFGDQTAF